jgi:hypothetical protein
VPLGGPGAEGKLQLAETSVRAGLDQGRAERGPLLARRSRLQSYPMSTAEAIPWRVLHWRLSPPRVGPGKLSTPDLPVYPVSQPVTVLQDPQNRCAPSW